MAASSRVFLDANVLVEIIDRHEHLNAAVRVIEEAGGRPVISSLTGHLVVYFGSKSSELPVLQRFLADFEMSALTQADFEWAFAHIRGNDFEGALQLSVAVRNG